MFTAVLASRWPKVMGRPGPAKRVEIRQVITSGSKTHERVLRLDAAEAAELGRRLLDWAWLTDPVAAVAAVGDTMASTR